MDIRTIYQIIPALSAGDAVGGQAVLLDSIWRGFGIETRLYAEYAAPDAGANAAGLDKVPRVLADDDVAIYHHSIGSAAAPIFCNIRGGRKIVIYHNITPPALLSGTPHLAAKAQQGLEQMSNLARAAALGVADSEYNRRQMLRAGFRRTTIAHLALDDEKHQALHTIAANRTSRTSPIQNPTLLYVGRIVPHKRIEELLRVLAICQSSGQSTLGLRIVGDAPETPKYLEALQSQITERGIKNVEFAGKKTGQPLFNEYAQADIYVCTSAHEGFCLPLLESMTAALPVVAFAAGAIPETMNGTGLIIPNRDHFQFAEAVQLLLGDPSTRHTLVAAQTNRSADFSHEKLATIWKNLLTSPEC